jgi:hypothetical protein
MQAKYKIAGVSAILALSLGVSNAFAGECGASTSSSVVAIDFDYYVTKDKGRWVTLSATSEDIEWNKLNERWPKRYKAFKYGGGAAINQWKIDDVPANGVLYNGTTPVSAGDTIADPDDLYYTPNIGYTGTDTFTYCASDSSGRSNVATVSINVADPASYPMPYGVPDPGFGINEEPPADPAEWPDAEATGYYYIDSDHPDCTDDNTFGYPNRPRCTMAYNTTVNAGKKAVLANSSRPYELRNSSWDRIYLNGTSNNPAWLVGDERGPDKPRITLNSARDGLTQLRIEGTGYYRIGGIDVDGPNIDNRGNIRGSVVRYSRFRNYPSTAGGGTTLDISSPSKESNVLAFQVNLHDNGIISPTLGEERDIHAFTIINQDRMWMLDIMCSENAGDCVQLTNNNTSSNVYVGRAVMHSMMENCIDYKDFNNFVVSESDCWDLREVSYASGSGGHAQNYYVNDEGNQQGYGYFLNNRSWDTSGTNYGASNIGGRVYFIGNIAFFSPQADGLSSTTGSGERHYYFNTVNNVRRGIFMYTAGGSNDRYAVGNYVGNATYASFAAASTDDINSIDYNYYVNADTFAWGSNSSPNTGSISQYRSATGFERNSIMGDQGGFASLSLFDFDLVSNSGLRDKIQRSSLSSIAPGVARLESDLGVTFTDYNGTQRTGSMLDIGADEFAGLEISPPMPPSSVEAVITN